MQMNKSLADMVEWIRARDEFAVLPHISPDGDALGSALALNGALRRIGKRAFIACEDSPPRLYDFLPDIGAVRAMDARPFEPRWLIFVDVAARDRIGALEPWIGKVEGAAVIDHHATNEGFGDINWIDPDASSTGEMIGGLIAAMELSIDRETAVWLYTAISTDTGDFSFSCTTPKALRLVADMVENGLELDAYNTLLFHRRTLSRTKLLGEALSALRLTHSGRIAYTRLTDELFEKCGAARDETESIVNYLKEIEGIEVAITAEQRGAQTKFSLRSNGQIHVGALAGALGGGGHERAAGVTIDLPLDEALAKVIEYVEDRLE